MTAIVLTCFGFKFSNKASPDSVSSILEFITVDISITGNLLVVLDVVTVSV